MRCSKSVYIFNLCPFEIITKVVFFCQLFFVSCFINIIDLSHLYDLSNSIDPFQKFNERKRAGQELRKGGANLWQGLICWQASSPSWAIVSQVHPVAGTAMGGHHGGGWQDVRLAPKVHPAGRQGAGGSIRYIWESLLKSPQEWLRSVERPQIRRPISFLEVVSMFGKRK